MIHMLDRDWKTRLSHGLNTTKFLKLTSFVDQERKTHVVLPLAEHCFKAFNLCNFKDVKVVILGQDPYHGEAQANGLAFSVDDGVSHPPSLKNIFKELHNDINVEIPRSGSLMHWAQQGVLLLNATLTVRAGEAGSHQKQGWEEFTDHAISTISDEKDHVVFILWGTYAQKKGQMIDHKKHCILTSAHPSPLSAYRGFFGNRHFSRANEFLKSHKIKPIKW
jgi:uracil-DNA glycosylase